MTEEPQTLFRFTAAGVDLEFSGSEGFVEKQLDRFKQFLQGAVGQETLAEATPAPEPRAAASTPPETLEEFYAARPVREGRGSIQDRILLFVYYLESVAGKREVSGDDIHWCFQKLGFERPKNLHNALGILKRKLNHLQEGSRRGLYSLSPSGRAFVTGRFSA